MYFPMKPSSLFNLSAEQSKTEPNPLSTPVSTITLGFTILTNAYQPNLLPNSILSSVTIFALFFILNSICFNSYKFL